MKNILFISIAVMILVLSNFVYIEESSAIQNSNLYGIASWYSRQDPGIKKTTANMEQFDDTKLTCAMWGVPFGTLVKVTNLSNGKSIIVRVNDRGPAKRLFRKGRVVDLTKEAFSRIAHPKKGLVAVNVIVFPSQSTYQT